MNIQFDEDKENKRITISQIRVKVLSNLCILRIDIKSGYNLLSTQIVEILNLFHPIGGKGNKGK